MNIYATLVVRLAHSGIFTLRSEDMWRNAAIFGSAAGGQFGLALGGEIDEGSGDLASFYPNGIKTGLKAQFEQFVRGHLEPKALEGTFQRRRIFTCSDCGTPVSNIVDQRAKERGKERIDCPVCETPISLVEGKEVEAPATRAAVASMEEQADSERDRAVALSVIEGKRATNDYDVFLCHNSRDKKTVKRIGERLKERGICRGWTNGTFRPVPYGLMNSRSNSPTSSRRRFFSPKRRGCVAERGDQGAPQPILQEKSVLSSRSFCLSEKVIPDCPPS